MVGRGYLKPDLTKVRHDTPKGLLALLEKCIKFCRDERLEFEQVDMYFYLVSQLNYFMEIFVKYSHQI